MRRAKLDKLQNCRVLGGGRRRFQPHWGSKIWKIDSRPLANRAGTCGRQVASPFHTTWAPAVENELSSLLSLFTKANLAKQRPNFCRTAPAGLDWQKVIQ